MCLGKLLRMNVEYMQMWVRLKFIDVFFGKDKVYKVWDVGRKGEYRI